MTIDKELRKEETLKSGDDDGGRGVMVGRVARCVQRVAMLVCGFNLLVALIQAHFWHFTEPSTLGFKVWPVLVINAALCGPGLALALPHVRRATFPPLVRHLMLLPVCPLILTAAAMPALDSQATVRTAILALGTFLFPLVITWTWSPAAAPPGGEFVIAVFVTSCARLSTRSVNGFYETPELGGALAATIISTAVAAHLLNAPSSGPPSSPCDDDKTIETTLGDDEEIGVGDKKPPPPPADAEEEDESFPWLLLAAMVVVQGGLAASMSVFIKYFTSPHMMVRWCGFESRSPLVYLVFAVMFASALICSVHEEIFPTTTTTMMSAMRDQKRGEGEWIRIRLLTPNLIFLFSTLIGSLLFIFPPSPVVSITGACLLLASLPPLFLRLLHVYLGLLRHRMMTSSARGGWAWGVGMAVGGLGLFLLHMLNISFTLTDLTSLLIARLDVVHLTEISLVIAALPAAEFVALRLPSAPSVGDSRRYRRERSTTKMTIVVVAAVASLLATLATPSTWITCRKPVTSSPLSDATSAGHVRVMTWNMLLGHTMTGRDNCACASRLIDHHRPHVIAFQESDPLPPFWGGKDFLTALALGPSYKPLGGAAPKSSTIGVGLMTQLEVTSHRAEILPVSESNTLLHYAYTVSHFRLPSDRPLHVISAHAVYRNWTRGGDPEAMGRLSRSHIQVLADAAAAIEPRGDPVIVMGDLNLNPHEPELDPLYESGFRSALNPDGRSARNESTTLDAFANIDHIFYKNLRLVRPATILSSAGSLSDHFPVMADFELIDPPP